jgi:ligand-binding sensor domain-containing protein/signal transduction histidine kinase
MSFRESFSIWRKSRLTWPVLCGHGSTWSLNGFRHVWYARVLGMNAGARKTRFSPQVTALWLLFVLMPALGGESSADVARYASRHWQTQDGLPHNAVQAIAQTSDGYLWLGTARGLARFDGVRFTVFDSKNTPALKSPSIKALAAGKEGRLWLGTAESGVLEYRRGQFVRLGLDQTNQSVCALWPGSDGTLWVGTPNGLDRVQKGHSQRVLEEDEVRSIGEDHEGNLWLATQRGPKKFRDGQFVPVTEAKVRGVGTIACGREGAVWVGGRGGVTRMLEGEIKHFSQREGLAADTVNALLQDRSGTMWIGTAAGLNYLAPDDTLHEIKQEGGSLDSVFCIFEDREGSVWIGARDGLYRFTVKLFVTYTKEHGLANANVTSVRGRADKLWIGTWGGGLHCLEGGRITRLSFTNEFFNGLVLGLHEQTSGSLWFGTDGEGGTFRYDPKGTLTRYWQGQFSNLADPSARAILLDRRKGRIWVGTPQALDVAFRYQPFWRYTVENGLAGNSVRALAEDARGDVWVGTDEGLTQFKADDTLVNFTTQHGLPHNTITALYEDADNNLWIGTSGGLSRRRNGVFTNYTTRQGLFSDEIFEIVEDDARRLWLTCGSGIFWVAKADFDALAAGKIQALGCVSYGKEDGLATLTCNNVAKPSAWKASDGRLWFATVKGLSVVDPAAISRAVSEPAPVLVEQILCDRKPFEAKDGLALPPGRGELEFQFTALSFLAPERNRFKYRLEGLDTDWNDAGVRRSARYNNVPPGAYRFRVLACNSAGVWNKAGAAVAFALRPHSWQTWWFKLVLFLSAGALAAALYRVRIARMRAIERMRLRIASDLHDEIGSGISTIALLARKIQKEGPLAEAPQTDLASIQRIATQTSSAVRDIVWFINPQYDTMQELLLRMKAAADALLGGLQLRFSPPQENLARRVSPEFRRNVFLMFKETLTNIAKHSQATEVGVEVLDKNGLWLLMVRDNGVGFDLNTIRRGNGLNNLRQRAERLGGTVEVRTQSGSGTTVIFSTSNNRW